MQETYDAFIALRERIQARLSTIQEEPCASLGTYKEMRLVLTFVADALTELEEQEAVPGATFPYCV